MSNGGRKEQRNEGAVGGRRIWACGAIFDPLWRKRKLATPPLPTFSIIPIACPCTKGKALRRRQNLLPRERLRDARSLPVIQSRSPIRRGLKVPNRSEENLQERWTTPHMAKEDRSESLRNEVQELKEEAAALADRAKKAARHAEVLVERIKHLETQIAKTS